MPQHPLVAINIKMTIEPFSTVEQVYSALHERGLTRSMRNFSVIWLGRAPNFAAINKARRPLADNLVAVRTRLIHEGQHDLAARALVTLLGGLPTPQEMVQPDQRRRGWHLPWNR